MRSTMYNAFGYTIQKDNHDKGHVEEVNVATPFNKNVTIDTLDIYSKHNIRLVTSGNISVLHTNTGRVSSQGPGWNNLDDLEPVGKYISTMIADTEIFFIFFDVNMVPIVPDVDIVHIPANSTKTFLQGQRIFLAAGTFTYSGVEVLGPRAVTFGSNKEVTATSDCFMFNFK